MQKRVKPPKTKRPAIPTFNRDQDDADQPQPLPTITSGIPQLTPVEKDDADSDDGTTGRTPLVPISRSEAKEQRKLKRTPVLLLNKNAEPKSDNQSSSPTPVRKLRQLRIESSDEEKVPRPSLKSSSSKAPRKLRQLRIDSSDEEKAPKPSVKSSSSQAPRKQRPLRLEVSSDDEQPEGGLNLAVLARQNMRLMRILKGDATKVSCMFDIGGTSYIVKAGFGNGYIKDHLLHTQLVHELQLPGIYAPDVVPLTPGFRRLLANSFEGDDGPQAAIFLKALGENDQIATLAPGFTIEKLLDDRSDQRSLIKVASSKDRDAAIRALFAQIKFVGTLNGKGEQGHALLDIVLNSPSPKTRRRALEDLQNMVFQPGHQQVLALIGSIDENGVENALLGLKAGLDELDGAMELLFSSARKPMVAARLGALCCLDLVCGMNDRVLGKWNGGNFMFNPDDGALWCVDNAKSDFGLSSDDHASWLNFMWQIAKDARVDTGESMARRIHAILYGKDGRLLPPELELNKLEAAETFEAVRDGVGFTLDRLFAAATSRRSALPPEVQKNLLLRLQALDRRKTFCGMCQFDPHFATVPSVDKAGKGEVVVRLFIPKGKLQKSAKELKDAARDGELDATQLLQREYDLLEAQRNAAIKDEDRDRRLDKALFEAKLARLVLYLEELTEDLAKRKAIVESKLSDVGSVDALKAALQLNVQTGVLPWQKQLLRLGDEDGALALQTVVDEFSKRLSQL